MKILVTGAAGFIGSHLVEYLVKEGHEVRAFVRYNSKSSWGWLDTSEVKDSIEVVAGDISDYDSVFAALENCNCVFHLAALIGIPYSYVSPMAYIRTNIQGTYNVLEAARKRKTEQVLVTSTSETYGTAQYIPIDEKHPLVGQSPYSASKIGADQLAISYFRSFDTPVKIVRPFNTYGPRQSARAIIPTVISQVLSGRTNIKLGNLAPTRDLTFVKDTVAGFVAIMREPSFLGAVTNIGMNDEISVGDLVKKIGSLMGVPINVMEDQQRIRPEKSEVEQLVCANNKIISTTPWRPRYDLNKGLQETIEFIKRNLHLYKAEQYNV